MFMVGLKANADMAQENHGEKVFKVITPLN